MSAASNLKSFANAISTCAEDIDALTSNHSDPYLFEKNSKHWDFLQTHGFIYHCGDSYYKGTPSLYELVANLGMRSTMRRVAPDINDWYETLETDIEHMAEATSVGDENSRKNHLQRIDYHVALMINSLEKEVLDIEYSINSKLGKMESLKAKVNENKRLISRTHLFVVKLSSLKMDRLIPYANKDFQLRTMLLMNMSPRISEYSYRLSSALPRLEKMLYQSQQKTKETEKIWALYRHFESSKQCLQDDFSDEEIQESIFNSAMPLIMSASLDSNKCEDKEIISIAENLKRRMEKDTSLLTENIEKTKYIDTKDDTVDFVEPVLYPYFIDFIKTLSKKPCSAMEFWDKQSSNYSGRSWLMWLTLEVDKHKGLSSESLYLKTAPRCANQSIYDLKVCVTNGS